MKHRATTVILFLLLGAIVFGLHVVLVATGASQQAIAASIGETLREVVIVRAVVGPDSKITPDRSVITHQVVDYVYCGSGIGLGDSFEDASEGERPAGGSFAQALLRPPLRPGENGIWLLRRRTDSFHRKAYPEYGVTWPARPDITPRFDAIQSLANAFHAIWVADNETQRLQLVKEYARSEVQEVSVAAIMLMAQAAPDDLNALSADLLAAHPVIGVQLALDEALSTTDVHHWRSSHERQELVKQWPALATDEQTAFQILDRLRNAILRGQIQPDLLFETVTPFVLGAQHTKEVRKRAVELFRWLLNDQTIHEDVFKVLANILEGTEDDQLQLVAAKALTFARTFKSDEIARLVAMRDAWQTRAIEATDERSPVKTIASLLQQTVKQVIEA